MYVVHILILCKCELNCTCEGVPVVTSEVLDQTLTEGDTAIFTCQAIGIPIPTISWYFNSAPVEKSNAVKYLISENSVNPITTKTMLIVLNLELSDIGTYACSATNIVSSNTSYGVLTVNGKLD